MRRNPLTIARFFVAALGKPKRILSLLASALILSLHSQSALAQKPHHLAEFLFWDALGDTISKGAQAHADYRAQRQLWRDKINAAKAELEKCGGCASAQAELDKWQGIENEFQSVAGALAQASGMPPSVAKWLDIDLPLTSGLTQAHREEHRILRPEWIDERPEFCRVPSEQFVRCIQNFQEQRGLLGDWERETTPGGECYELRKLNDHCFNKDYDAFAHEIELQKRRENGEIIAEYTRVTAPTSTVYFGKVPDEFIPTFPPPNVIRAELAEKARAVRYVMYKQGSGYLGGFIIEGLVPVVNLPETTCGRVGVNHDEVERRECDDINELFGRYGQPLVLSCLYTRPGGTRASDHDYSIYWYDTRPEFVDPTGLLPRSHGHPLLKIEDPRTDCPATKSEADEISKQYLKGLASLREQIPQTPGDVVIPESDWHREIRESNEEAYQAALTAYLSVFPIEGRYSSRTFPPGSDKKAESDCTIESINSNQFKFICKRRGYKPKAEAIGTLEGSVIVVHWDNKRFTYHTKGDGETLFGWDDRKIRFHHLSRRGDLDLKDSEATASRAGQNPQALGNIAVPPAQGKKEYQRQAAPTESLSSFPIEGRYSSKTFPLSTQRRAESLCTIENSGPAQFKFICEAGGQKYEATGMLEASDIVVQWGGLRMAYTAQGSDKLLGKDMQKSNLRHILVREGELEKPGETVVAATAARLETAQATEFENGIAGVQRASDAPSAGKTERYVPLQEENLEHTEETEVATAASRVETAAVNPESSIGDVESAPDVPSIRTTKDVYAVHERITVEFSKAPGNLKDWITVVPQGTPEEITPEVKLQYKIRNVFTQRHKEGKRNFPGQAAGSYEARLYSQDSAEKAIARYAFRIGTADNETVEGKD